MILRTFVTCVLTLVFVVPFSQAVLATMGGVTSVGPLFTQGDSSTAIRELVELEKSGELLVARPRHALVEMITLYAPGLDQGHLILRELLTREGKQTLLLTAPDAVMTHVQRATLYTRGLRENLVLLENVNGVWEKRLPQSFVIESPIAGAVSAQTLRAFSVQTLGFYWLLEPAAARSVISHAPEATSARTLMGGKLIWGLLPSIFGILLFILLGTLSRYIHRTEKLPGL
jgi:hypothetical protein